MVVRSTKRVVALLTVRNEALYLNRCLTHLHEQGVETCVIDNDSTDESLEIAREFVGRGVFRIERQPYDGYFDLVRQLQIKEQLAEEIEADWFLHHDADEIREDPTGNRSLIDALMTAGEAGYNAVNFEEFVFAPTEQHDPDAVPSDYVKEFRHYYYFSPRPLHRVNAWTKRSSRVDLVSHAGHQVLFSGRRISPESLALRHYIALSRSHFLRKYGAERIYSEREVTERGWHGGRARFSCDRARLPKMDELIDLDSAGWDRSRPLRTHPIFEE